MASALAAAGVGRWSDAIGREVRREVAVGGQPQRMVRWAAAGVVACSAIWPLWFLINFLVAPPATGIGRLVVGTALLLPPYVWLVWAAAEGRRPRGAGAALALLALIVVGGVPLVGLSWLSTFAAPGLAADRPAGALVVGGAPRSNFASGKSES